MDRTCKTCGVDRHGYYMIRIAEDWYCGKCIADQLVTQAQQNIYSRFTDQMLAKLAEQLENHVHDD